MEYFQRIVDHGEEFLVFIVKATAKNDGADHVGH